ncbi:hypothetical protein ACGFZB_24990 [Streptomyces cinerochromogenes]|uniref:Uncharacterized protein n=1 Tax=Streptomyces cinerochromogenes TaxID=66422 RepID=A0ABW7B8X6_9ACTN
MAQRVTRTTGGAQDTECFNWREAPTATQLTEVALPTVLIGAGQGLVLAR